MKRRRSQVLSLIAVAASVGMTSLAPSVAAAGIRHVTIDDPAEQRPPNLDPNDPVHYVADLRSLTVDYDEAGNVRTSLTFNEDENRNQDPGYDSWDYGWKLDGCSAPAPRLNFQMGHFVSSDGAVSDRFFVSMDGADGTLQGTPAVSPDGRTWTAEFGHPAFAGKDWRCVTNWPGNGDPFEEPRWFDGLAPPPPPPTPTPTPRPAPRQTPTPTPTPRNVRDVKLTSQSATAAALDFVGRRFGDAFARDRAAWLKCPAVEILKSDDDEPYALCEFRYRDGRNVQYGGFAVVLRDGEFRTRWLYHHLWAARARTCSIRTRKGGYVNGVHLSRRKLRVKGVFSCRWLPGSAGQVNDIDADVARRYPRHLPRVYRVYEHGTNRAGFEAAAVARCDVKRTGHHYRMRCANRVGDSFTYSFVASRAARKPAPRPHQEPTLPPRRCHAGYSGACLDPNASDYDCVGGGGDGPRYTGEVRVTGDDPYDLDRDGDGIGCDE